MKILALGLAALALLPAPALANIDYSLGSEPILVDRTESETIEAMPDFTASTESGELHVFIEVRQHHRYGTFFVVFEGSCASLAVRPIFAGGVNDAGREFSPSPVSLPWDFEKEGMKTLIARYCHEVN